MSLLTLDDLTTTENKLERSTSGVGVELLAVGQLADVTHAEALAGLGDGALSEFGVLDDKTGRKGLLMRKPGSSHSVVCYRREDR
jgi:hypothetical protein